jgi:hypothetical protein
VAPDVPRSLADRVRYLGSGFHKLHSGDYGFVPPRNPRPSKSPCDQIHPVLREEATALFRRAIERGMVSAFAGNGVPKYVWAVDDGGEVYEAKTKAERENDYHGYRLGEDDDEMRRHVRAEWNRRRP